MLTQLAFFHDPVDTVVVFDYLSVCPKPMDFSSILHTRAAPPHAISTRLYTTRRSRPAVTHHLGGEEEAGDHTLRPTR